ncbi:hypothetical protein GOB83_02445 [Acetobacter fabarum]|jgi:chromosome segregation ATPase|uniref:hypothetical protein n=1 Tax=Acetobacter TaxID=434 RepID=UPI000A386390|nr:MULTISPECIES: hypothetical protein [Acetobacter]MCI1242772.1 hypothetical protein [Acetobacter fabarum]MCI1908607.1 hypothetical protein [Acetobacter fabarum]MCI1926683.1 hypothetical protein [Acetobacter fabarum]MCI1946682.1 hypothetical protein [Acetobacter fabarum]MCI1988096.1 hypothetical protein [Acetobacter fabarum]
MNTSSFLSAPVVDRDHEEGLEEASMRNALERIGHSARPRSSAAPQPRPAAESANNKRRRFVRDGEVQVEKHSLARTTPRTVAAPRIAGTSRAVHFNEEDNSELSRLRRQLAEEKLRAEESDRQLADMQAAQRGLTTRIGHADALIAEQKNKLAEREAELALAGREIRAGRRQMEEQEAEIAALRRQLDAKPRGRPRKEPEVVEAEVRVEEPQPVKWWKD